MKRPLILPLAIAFGLLSGHASAQANPSAGTGCRVEGQATPSRWEIRGFDPYDSDNAIGQFDIIWRNTGTTPCNGDVHTTVDTLPFGLTGASGPGAALMYTIIDDYQGRDLTPVGGVSPPPTGGQLQIKPGEGVSQRYTFSVDVDRLSGDGLFEETLSFSFVSRNGEVRGEEPIQLGLDVTPSAVMGLRGAFSRTEGGGRIDLGELSDGVTNLPLQLWVRSTRSYQVAVSSANRGRLVLEGGGNWSVPYTLRLGDQAMNLAGISLLTVPSGTGLDEHAHAISILVGDTTGKRAGIYRDLIELTIAPL